MLHQKGASCKKLKAARTMLECVFRESATAGAARLGPKGE